MNGLSKLLTARGTTGSCITTLRNTPHVMAIANLVSASAAPTGGARMEGSAEGEREGKDETDGFHGEERFRSSRR